MTTTTSTLKEFVAANAGQLANVDYAKMRGVAKAVYDDPSLLDAFAQDPEATARAINGFEVPEGFHLHIADAQNNFIPPEEEGIFGAEGIDTWGRIETRAGYKTVSLVMCAAPAEH